MPKKKSVGAAGSIPNKITDEVLILDSYEGQGARGVWGAIAYCESSRLPYPDWVRSYLIRVARAIENVSRQQSPWTLWQAMELYKERKPDAYEPLRDPEEVYLIIRDWHSSGEVRKVSEGVRRYMKERLKVGDKTPEATVRHWYYKGKETWNAHEAPAHSEKVSTAA